MINDQVIIFDDIIPKHYQDNLESLFFGNFPFNFGPNYNSTSQFSNPLKFSNEKIYEQFQLVNVMVENGEIINNGKYFYFFLTPLIITLSKLGLMFKRENLIRVKSNLQTKAYENVTNKFNIPHIDQNINPSNLLIILYYINDTDGDTYIFNKKHQKTDIPEEINYDILSIKEKISPKKGRVGVFSGENYHAGIHPQNNMFRGIINYNYYLDI